MQRKKLIEISVTAVLVIVLIFAVSGSLRKIAQKKQAAIKPSSAVVPVEKKVILKGQDGAPVVLNDLFNTLDEESRDLELKRDPFTNAPVAPVIVASPSGLNLSGIMWNKRKPLAIINNKVVKVGDRAGGNIVVEIKVDRVILSDGERQFEVKLSH